MVIFERIDAVGLYQCDVLVNASHELCLFSHVILAALARS